MSTGCTRRVKSWPLWRQQDFCHQLQWRQDITGPPLPDWQIFGRSSPFPWHLLSRLPQPPSGLPPATCKCDESCFTVACVLNWDTTAGPYFMLMSFENQCACVSSPPVSWDVPLAPQHIFNPSTLLLCTTATHWQALCNRPWQKSQGLLSVSTRLFQRRYFEDWGTCS